MPLTPSYGDRRAGPVVRLYRRTERKLLELLAKTLAPGIGHLAIWARRLLMRLGKFRRDVDTIITATDRELPARLTTALTGAWRDGATAARSDLPGRHNPPDERQLRRLIDDTLATVRATHDHVPRVLESVYRRTVYDALQAEQAGQTGGPVDRARVVQRALHAFARQGITGFIDARGRRYDLVSYVEVTVRSAITRAEVDAYCAQAQADGHDLVIVSDVSGACERCRPFEGQVLSISGTTVGAVSRAASSGRPVAVTVLCSIAEARARGLWHPGCRHTLSVWTPDDPAPPAAVRVPDEVRQARRRQRAVVRRERQRQRVAVVDSAMRNGEAPAMARQGSGEDRPNRDNLPEDIPPSPFDDATSPAEVAAILEQLHPVRVEGFDRPGVSLTVAQEYARAVHDMMTRYPQMQPNVIAIGEVRDPRAHRINARTPSRRSRDGGDWYVEQLLMNEMFAGDYEGWRTSAAQDVASGFHPPGFDRRPVYATIVHEFGHVLDVAGNHGARAEVARTLDRYYQQNYPLQPGEKPQDWMRKFNIWLHQLSEYCFKEEGGLELREALAESFAEVEIRGEDACEPAKVLYQLLLDKARRPQ
ncbi:hypothetical protein IU443_29750 [Nocardia farcinica]|uniref:phage minor capsid protein n=1 Tax=Nocardia farcinica TaxID=37329 RepID=UPI0009CB1C63|nr:phage minor capsid protein [Nocardia farcinica]MBF6394116.1 hypothetical protein [Nocardia farcinica]SLG33996.1 Phage minor capsid protein 2 [Mycobacteroides abscessus subsp. abscessus]